MLDVGGGGISSMIERSHVYVVINIEISAKRRVRRSSLVPRPRPAFRRYCKRRKAGRGLGTRLRRSVSRLAPWFVRRFQVLLE